MDPRHPELALPRVKELIKQYERVEMDISNATVSAKLGELEHEGVLVVNELFIIVPRLQERLMQDSRNRRMALSRGEVNQFGYIPEEKLGNGLIKATIGLTDNPVENSMGLEEIVETLADPAPVKEVEQLKEVYVAPNQAETVIVEPKPRKKKTTKKAEK